MIRNQPSGIISYLSVIILSLKPVSVKFLVNSGVLFKELNFLTVCIIAIKEDKMYLFSWVCLDRIPSLFFLLFFSLATSVQAICFTIDLHLFLTEGSS